VFIAGATGLAPHLLGGVEALEKARALARTELARYEKR
jgi:hypothetical protein